MNRTLTVCFAALLLMAQGSPGALTPEQIKALPPPASHPVDFKADIKPIFEASCIRCHGRGRKRGGFQINSRQSLLKGGDTGPGAIAGNSAGSYLIELVSGLNSDEVMPKKGKRLTPEEVGVIRAWIDLLKDGDLVSNGLSSLYRAFAGLGLAILVGATLG